MRDSVLLDGGYGIVSTAEEFDELLDRVTAEWETNECYAIYYTITARSPATSFTAPPWSLSMPEIFEFHAKHNRHLPFYRFAEDDNLQHISYSTLAAAIQRAAKLALAASGQRDSPVAVLAVTGKHACETSILSSPTTKCSISRLHHTHFHHARLFQGRSQGTYRSQFHLKDTILISSRPQVFFVSPRNSAAAVSHLLEKTGSQCLLVSSDEGMQQLAEAAIGQDKLEVSIKPMPTYEQLFKAPEEAPVPLLDSYSLDSVALILHSSGSTNFPKPIQLTHRNLVEWGRGAHGEREFEGEVLGGHSLAFFHAMGV